MEYTRGYDRVVTALVSTHYQVLKDKEYPWPCDSDPNRKIEVDTDDVLQRDEPGSYTMLTGIAKVGILIPDKDVVETRKTVAPIGHHRWAERLDRLASELESKGLIKLAYDIDKVSDELEKSAGIGQDIKKLLSEGWKWIKSKVVDEPNAEKVLKEYGVEWDKKEKVPAGYPGSGNVEYTYKNEPRPVSVWDVIRQQVLVPDRYWGNPVKINKKDVEYYNKPGE